MMLCFQGKVPALVPMAIAGDFVTYNVWFDESVAVHGRMAAITSILADRAPTVVGLQGRRCVPK
jgi:hypothetical protein